MGSKILLLFTLTLMCSCLKQTEMITPIAPPQTLSELQKESMMTTALVAGNADLSSTANANIETTNVPGVFYLNVKYNWNDIDVFGTANIPNSFEQIGHSFLSNIAKFMLAVIGPKKIVLAPFDFIIPDLNLDLSVVKSIKIKKLSFQYSKKIVKQKGSLANFGFINSIELLREVDDSEKGRIDKPLINYQKNKNKCELNCIQFEVIEDNLLDMLVDNRVPLKLKPKLSIASIPAVTDLTLDGVVELQIGLKLPF